MNYAKIEKIIPLEEMQELVLLKEDPKSFDEKLWTITHKYQVVYVKVLAYYKKLVEGD